MLSPPMWRQSKSLSSIEMLSGVAWCTQLSWQKVHALIFGGRKNKTINELQTLQDGELKLQCGAKHVFGDWTYRYSWSTRFPSLPFQKEGGFHSWYMPTSHWKKLGSNFMLTASFLPCLPAYTTIFTICSVKFSLRNAEKLLFCFSWAINGEVFWDYLFLTGVESHFSHMFVIRPWPHCNLPELLNFETTLWRAASG